MESNRDGYGLTRHQQHVIAHVLGCELLAFGYLKNEAIFVLDIPFIWAIAADGSMDLGSSDDIGARLDLDENDRDRLAGQSESLRDGGFDESEDTLFTELPPGIRITSVNCEALTDSRARTTIICDGLNLVIDSEDDQIKVHIEQ